MMSLRRRGALAVVAVAAAWLAGGPALGARAPQPVGGLTALPPVEAPGPNLLRHPELADHHGGGAAAWRLNPAEAWALAPDAGGRPALRLSGADRAARTPAAEQTVVLEPGFYILEGWARAEGLGAAAPGSGVRFCLDGRPRVDWWQCTPVARGTTDWTRLERRSIPVREAGEYRVTAGAYGAPDGVAWIGGVSLAQMRRPPLDVYLLYPNFRGLLFEDRSPMVRVALAATGRLPPGARIRLSLVDERRDAVLQQRDYPAASPVTGILDASALAVEDAALVRAELLDADGAVRYRHPDYRIVKTPANARRRLTVWYDERNVAHLGGRPTFVIGLYTTSGYSTSRQTYAVGRDGWGNDRIAQAPVDILINYHLGQAPVPALMTYMDDLRARGIYYLQTVNFYHEDHPQYRSIPYPAAREGEAALNRWVARTLGAHPGLAGFYTADERPAEMVPAVFRQRRILAEAAPGSVTYAVLGDGWEHQAPLWRDAVDVLGLDPYPVTRPAGQNHLAMVGEWTRIGQDAVKGSRPLWMVIQYFPLTRAGGWPTEDELRRMSWMAIVEGARGLFYWSFGARGLAWVKDPAERERRWHELLRVTREIKELEPVLLAPDARLIAHESSGGVVRTLGKRTPDGARYLFAYNSRAEPARVTWTLAAPASATLDLDTGAPGPAVAGDALTVELGPYGVKRYRLQ